jgi:hypothetical protein
MTTFDRKSFIETMGLLPLAAALSRDALFAEAINAPPHEAGARLMLIAHELHNQALYEAAISSFRAAEQTLGGGSSQAAFAGCMIAQMYINLGDYHTAEQEAVRVQNNYRFMMDYETKAEWFRIRNWLDYY